MSKRYANNSIDRSSPAKRPKLDITKTVGVVQHQRPQTKPVETPNEDYAWGSDFEEDDFYHFDKIESQVVNTSKGDPSSQPSQQSNQKNDLFQEPKLPTNNGTLANKKTSPIDRQLLCNKPSTNSALSERNIESQKKNVSTSRNQNIILPSQRLASSSDERELSNDTVSNSQFQNNLIAEPGLNSTFHHENFIVSIHDKDPKIKELEEKCAKLSNECNGKDGEILFWKRKLKLIETQNIKEKMAKQKEIDDAASNHANQLKKLTKEKEGLNEKLCLIEHELNSMKDSIERLKLNESRSKKVNQPQTNTLKDSPSAYGKQRPTINNIKKSTMSDSCIQVDFDEKIDYKFETRMDFYPLKDIPQSIFESPIREKSIVDIKIIETITEKSIPIIQDEESCRIFTNPILLKPLVTIIDNKQLSTELFLPELATLMTKTDTEINSSVSIPIINKIVLITMELLRNTTVVLQTIKDYMQNDDIRDMNDLYFSNFYKLKINFSKSFCDSQAWYEKERGIETRRAFSILAYIAKTSNYLSEFIAGKSNLITVGDMAYEKFSLQLIRYNAWKCKGQNYEFLKMIFEFIVLVGEIRRGHMFTGLISIILKTLCNVDKTTGFNGRGMEYINKIFRQIVFARPLMPCFIPITEAFSYFCKKSDSFVNNLCLNFTKKTVEMRNHELQFCMEACVLEVFMDQIRRFNFENFAKIDIANSIISIIDYVFTLEKFSWPLKHADAHKCREDLLVFALSIMYDILIINANNHRLEYEANYNGKFKFTDCYWTNLKKKHYATLRSGSRFLCYLSMRDHNIIFRIGEDKVQLFWEKIKKIDDLILGIVEKNASEYIDSYMDFNKPAQELNNVNKSNRLYNKKLGFSKIEEPTAQIKKWPPAEKIYRWLF